MTKEELEAITALWRKLMVRVYSPMRPKDEELETIADGMFALIQYAEKQLEAGKDQMQSTRLKITPPVYDEVYYDAMRKMNSD